MYERFIMTTDPDRFPIPRVRDIVDYLHEHDQHYIVSKVPIRRVPIVRCLTLDPHPPTEALRSQTDFAITDQPPQRYLLTFDLLS